MNPHLHPAIYAEIELGILVGAPCVAGLQTRHLHPERLLVELGGLHRPGSCTRLTSGKHIVDRLPSGVLLDVDNRHVELSLSRSVVAVVEIEFIVAPFSLDQFERGETEMGGLAKT